MITANRRARATIAFFIPRRLAIFIAQALSQDHLMVIEGCRHGARGGLAHAPRIGTDRLLSFRERKLGQGCCFANKEQQLPEDNNMADQVGLLRIGFAFSGIVAIVVIVAAISVSASMGVL